MENITNNKIAELLIKKYSFKKSTLQYYKGATEFVNSDYTIDLFEDGRLTIAKRTIKQVFHTLFDGVVSEYTLPVIMEAVLPAPNYIIQYKESHEPNLFIHGIPYVYEYDDTTLYLYDARLSKKDGYWFNLSFPDEKEVIKQLLNIVGGIPPTINKGVIYEKIKD